MLVRGQPRWLDSLPFFSTEFVPSILEATEGLARLPGFGRKEMYKTHQFRVMMIGSPVNLMQCFISKTGQHPCSFSFQLSSWVLTLPNFNIKISVEVVNCCVRKGRKTHLQKIENLLTCVFLLYACTSLLQLVRMNIKSGFAVCFLHSSSWYKICERNWLPTAIRAQNLQVVTEKRALGN